MIELILPVEEVNLILKHLGNAPYIEVAQLIQKIHTVAAPQVAEMTAKEQAERAARERHTINPPMAVTMDGAASNGAAHESR